MAHRSATAATHAVADVPALYRALAPVREALHARDAAVLEEQVAVTEIAAPTGAESRRAGWLAERLNALGLRDVRTDAAGNVLGRRPGRSGSAGMVVVCAHLDTVFPDGTAIAVRRDGARLEGPGIVDNGRGLAGMLALAHASSALPLSCDVLFVGTVGEEGNGDLRGAKHLFSQLDGVTAAIALDGAGEERIVTRALGARRLRLTVRGEGGHSWNAFGVANPAHAVAGAVARIAALRIPAQPRSTLSVCRLGGGLSVNAIPAEAWCEVDIRSLAGSVLARLERDVLEALRSAVREENERRAPGTDALTVEMTRIGDRPCGEMDDMHPLVRAACAATVAVGRTPALGVASTDANVPISLGIPAVAIGAGGRGGGVHTTDEWYDNEGGPEGLARALTLLVAAAGGTG